MPPEEHISNRSRLAHRRSRRYLMKGEKMMKNVLVCYKWVNDEADLIIHPDLTWDWNRSKGKISDYDKNAIEAAVQAAQKNHTQAIALTFGSSPAKVSIKDVLSRGPAAAYYVNAQQAESADGAVTAKVLAQAIARLDPGLIICADGASDTYARQVGPRIAARLNIPCLTAVTAFEISDPILKVTRRTESHLEIIQTSLPALITVLPEINPAPLPGLKAVLEAGKKPYTEWTPEDIGLSPADLMPEHSIITKPHLVERKKVRIQSQSPSEQVAALIEYLSKEGVL